MVSITQFSLHENVNERGTSNHPVTIGDLYLSYFNIPQLPQFMKLKKRLIAFQKFTRRFLSKEQQLANACKEKF